VGDGNGLVVEESYVVYAREGEPCAVAVFVEEFVAVDVQEPGYVVFQGDVHCDLCVAVLAVHDSRRGHVGSIGMALEEHDSRIVVEIVVDQGFEEGTFRRIVDEDHYQVEATEMVF